MSGRRAASPLLLLATLAVAGACGVASEPDLAASAERAATTATPPGSGGPSSAEAAAAEPTAAEGRALVAAHECHRCHEGLDLSPPPPAMRCVGCHVDIVEGRFEAPSASLARWKPRVAPLRFAPSLASIGATVKTSWIATWLLTPTDLRPGLHPQMPRMNLAPREAQAIALYLTSSHEVAPTSPGGVATRPADADRGRRHFDEKGCGRCHAFSGSGKAAPAPVRADEGRDRALAPDLRFARARLRPESVAAWIRDPASVRADAAMPKQAVTAQEALDLAAFVMSAPLMETARAAPPARLPRLDRPVTYDEVAARVLHRTCWHCHSQPDLARGDGGPGNTGGFGFAARRIDLSSYEGIAAGTVDAKGEPVSLFSPAPGREEPLLLAALLARQEEEGGRTSRVRGMPLGLPPLSPEDIQLVESWIAQGAPR